MKKGGNKMKKGILKVITTIIVFVTAMSSIVAAAPASVTVTTRSLTGVVPITGAPLNYKTITSGNASMKAYCLNRVLDAPSSGSRLTYKNEVTNAGIIYILENGYGGTWNASLLGSGLTNDQRFQATQIAVWVHQGMGVSSLNQSNAAHAAGIKLANAAKSATRVTPSIAISGSTTMYKEGSFYRSEMMTVNGSGYQNYGVNLINAGANAQIVTAAGQVLKSGATLASGTRFYLRIPTANVNASMSPIINVSAVGKQARVYQYTSGNSNLQDLGVLMYTATNLSQNRTMSLRVEQQTQPATAVIRKVDSSTGNLLTGASLRLSDSSGRVIATWTSTASARTISNLTPGTYTLTELSAPSGYQLNTTPITFSLSAGQTRTITMNNTPQQTQPATAIIRKVDSSTGNLLSGASLRLTDSSGRIVASWTSTAAARTISNLTPGTYTLTELSAPSGYQLNTTPIIITLVAGETKTITMNNTRIPVTPTYGVNILKIDNVTKQPLVGATLELRDSAGKVIETWESTTTAKKITGLALGSYSVVETKAPAGYVLNTTPLNFTITATSDPNRVIQFANNPEEKTERKPISISKQDVATSKELPGATLTIKDANGNVIETWISTNKPHQVILDPGTYTLIEKKSPKGYGLSDEVIQFTVNADGTVDAPVIMYNSKIPVTSDINIAVIIAGLIGTLSLAGFGMVKLSKQQ